MSRTRADSGFSLIELLFATGLLLIVSSIVTTALVQMTGSQKTIWNRTEMHSGIRGATELLQQEVGQAGRITLPGTGVVTLTNALVFATSWAACTPVTNVQVSSVAGMWGNANTGIALTFLDGDNEETVRVTNVNTGANTIDACFWKNHVANTPIRAFGGFANGIVPPTGIANGSSETKLKMFGDINGDGNMVYIEYTCDTTNKKLYRNVVAFNAGSLPAEDDSMVLLNNVVDNPADAGGVARPCFSYQTAQVTVPPNSTTFTFVTDVAITLTVETEQIDPSTKQKQRETKALLNVSPRNVFNAFSFARLSHSERLQSNPTTIVTLVCTNSPITCP